MTTLAVLRSPAKYVPRSQPQSPGAFLATVLMKYELAEFMASSTDAGVGCALARPAPSASAVLRISVEIEVAAEHRS
jgi:hypothetical protein